MKVKKLLYDRTVDRVDVFGNTIKRFSAYYEGGWNQHKRTITCFDFSRATPEIHTEAFIELSATLSSIPIWSLL